MSRAQQDPIYRQIDDVKQAVSDVLTHAKKLGATACEAAMSSTSGLSVSTRMGEVDTIEFNQDGGLGISVYVGNHKGSASTADLSSEALRSVVEKAVDIAKIDTFASAKTPEILAIMPVKEKPSGPITSKARHWVSTAKLSIVIVVGHTMESSSNVLEIKKISLENTACGIAWSTSRLCIEKSCSNNFKVCFDIITLYFLVIY